MPYHSDLYDPLYSVEHTMFCVYCSNKKQKKRTNA